MSDSIAVSVEELRHRYGEREALRGIRFSVSLGEIFGLLGPNGGGKTTLFRLLATLLPVQSGRATILGLDVASESRAVREMIGVTFQSPSLDGKLTVLENLKFQSLFYGLTGTPARQRIDELLARLGISDRRRDVVDSLSGGLKRRVEIAKSLLHQPRLLLLDEPSTGLDPGARHDLWAYLEKLRQEQGTTILVTTHLMEEAERCDRLGILNLGEIVALGTPEELRLSVGGDCLTIQSVNPDQLTDQIESRFQVTPRRIGDALRIECPAGHELLRDIVAAFPSEITSISYAKPTLEDVFIARAGHRFWESTPA
ncbi:ATP-binding cassette domain-containing protein [Schlesneria sp.]|uniref:ABC transporter ATP-binding protein n=1 Tax=Schlesneria sp. TaxID=2762018 RepID=UPI002EF1D73A